MVASRGCLAIRYSTRWTGPCTVFLKPLQPHSQHSADSLHSRQNLGQAAAREVVRPFLPAQGRCAKEAIRFEVPIHQQVEKPLDGEMRFQFARGVLERFDRILRDRFEGLLELRIGENLNEKGDHFGRGNCQGGRRKDAGREEERMREELDIGGHRSKLLARRGIVDDASQPVQPASKALNIACVNSEF